MLRRTHYAREALGLEPINPGPVVREFAVRVPDLDRLFELRPRRGHQPRLPAGATPIPSTGTGCWWRSPSAAPRRTSTGWPPWSAVRARGCPPDGRAAGSPRRRGDHHDLRALARGPARVHPAGRRRARGAGGGAAAGRRAAHASPPSCPRSPSPRSCATSTGCRRRTSTSTPASTRSGSCTMKHNPKLHERVAALPGPRPSAPAAGPRARAGRAGADVEPAGRARRRSRACRTSRCSRPRAPTASSPACCSPAPTTRTAASSASQGAHARHRARHQPGHGHDGGLRGREGGHRRARRRGHRRPARQGGRRRCLPDAHQPQHARACSTATSRRSPRSCTGWAPRSTTTGPTSTPSWASRGPATWASTSSTTTCTSPSPSPTAAAGRALGRSRCPIASSRSCRGRRWCAAARRATAPSPASSSTTTGPSRSASCAASRATSACSCAPTPTSAPSAATACGRRPRWPC